MQRTEDQNQELIVRRWTQITADKRSRADIEYWYGETNVLLWLNWLSFQLVKWLIIALVVTTDEDLQSQHNKLSRITLGNLSKLLIESKKISDEKKSLDVLEDCRIERNFLIHELSSYHGYDFNTEHGRAKVLERIYEGKAKILIGEKVVRNLMEKVISVCGGNLGAMKKEAQKYFD